MSVSKPAVLIVDDDEGIRESLRAVLESDHAIFESATGEDGLQIIESYNIHVVLLDIQLPGIDGMEVLQRIKNKFPDIEVIVITVVKDVDTAVKAMRLGAYYYLTKEFDYDDVRALLARVREKQASDKKILYLHGEMEKYLEEDFIIGRSMRMKEVDNIIQKSARLPATILITGESGTGKEMIARIIHKEFATEEMPFVTVNLAAIPDQLMESTLFGHEKGSFTGAITQRIGKFELADRGTIFLDEVGDLKLESQAKLLRVIQEGEIERVGGNRPIIVDVRIIAATSRDLEDMVKTGSFREDLYYRLNVVPIKLPPLRERLEDIPLLTRLFINKYNAKYRKAIRDIHPGVLAILSRHTWRGNIRELENLIERMVIMAGDGVLADRDLPIEYAFGSLGVYDQVEARKENILKKTMETFERNFLLGILERMNWSRKETARYLGVDLSTLKYRFKVLGIYSILHDREKKKRAAK
jgi:DNA-binding NtrC family response regulator